MNQDDIELTERCLSASEDGSLSFPEIVAILINAGFEAYRVDFRRRTATYYKPDGSWCEHPKPGEGLVVAEAFDPAAIQFQIRRAQAPAPDYSYPHFCQAITAAGCSDYLVSFLGRRAVYSGRSGESHVEPFPD